MPKLLEEFPPVSTDAWEAAIRVDLKGADYDKTLIWKAEDGIAVKPYYRAADSANLDPHPLRSTPGWRICEPGNEPAIDIDAAKFDEHGSTTVQELGFTLAEGIEHLAEQKSHHLTFQFAIGSNYFFQIAKLRAFRLLWTRVLQEFKIDDAKTTLHCRTSKWNKSIYDAHVNILRATTEALSAIIGGADSITVDPFDATYKNPDAASQRLALNTQLILKHEAYLDRVADPAAGSYYLEVLTDSLAREAWKLMQTIEENGGYSKSHTMMHANLAESQAIKQSAIAERKHVFVGVNKYPNATERALPKVEKPLDTDEQRGPEPFERIRLDTERSQHTPVILLAEIGDPKVSGNRLQAAADFFGCAGFSIEQKRFQTVEEINSPTADITVICSSDAEYAKLPRNAIVADSALLRGNALAKLTAWQHKLGIKS
jgi:methylmalonyl-CoA mutase